jgi:hypothetical protein
LLLNFARAVWVRRTDLAVVITAVAGFALFWSPFSNLSALSWWYDRMPPGRIESTVPIPDYDLNTLPWKVAHPRVFDLQPHQLVLVTDPEPFAYQAFATVNTDGASSAAIQFEADIESGGTTIGLLQSGKWIAVSSSHRRGVFSDASAAQLGYSRSITLTIANNNPAGETRLTLKSLRLYFRK